MSTQPQQFYPHRRNWDGSYDSICPRCYRTIANGRNEAALAEDEHGHVCKGWHVERLQPQERSQNRSLKIQTH